MIGSHAAGYDRFHKGGLRSRRTSTKTVYPARPYRKNMIQLVNVQISDSSEREFVVLMIALSIVIFVAVWRDERDETA